MMTSRTSNPTRNALTIACIALLAACAAPATRPGNADLQRQVADTERAFAKTMADRNHAAFIAFLSAETVFFTGPKPLHGKDEVAAAWKRFYEKPDAPFSWEPDTVEVLASGALAVSSGPVRDPSGKLFATFTSIWRQEAPGVWRIIFDKGNDVCACPKAP
jgi:ketosteroid isomerase-like protein